MRARAVFLLAVPLLVVIDQSSKAWAAKHLQGQPARSLLAGFIELRFTTNRGALFGATAGLGTALLQVLLVAIGFAVALWLTRLLSAAVVSGRMRQALAFGLTLVGVTGNTLDRLRHSQVIDFIHLRLADLVELGTINLADVAVVVGLLLLIPELFRRQTPSRLPANAGTTRS